MTIAVIGSRDPGIVDTKHIKERIPESCTKIISGGAPGVDMLAEQTAREMRINFKSILPDYSKFGHTAPLKRNIEIIKSADLVIAFWDFKSRGTAHTIAQCIKNEIPVRIYSTCVIDY